MSVEPVEMAEEATERMEEDGEGHTRMNLDEVLEGSLEEKEVCLRKFAAWGEQEQVGTIIY